MDKRTIVNTFRGLGGFCGWKKIMNVYNSISEPETRAIFGGIFFLGCRAMELPLLRHTQVDLDSSDIQIWIRGMYVLKQKKLQYLLDQDGNNILRSDGKRKYTFKSKDGYRTFPIRKDNPLSEDFINYINRFSGNDVLYPYSYNQIYYRICTIGMKLPKWELRANWCKYKGEWWPHRLRAERACQLIRDAKYDMFRLMGWFGWTSKEMPLDYGVIQGAGLAYDMDIDYR